jgi:hypothetical protein
MGAIKFRQDFNPRFWNEVFHRLPGNFPGLVRTDCVRNQRQIGERWMVADPAPDLGCVVAATVVEPAILIAARRRVMFGLGVTQQQQTAHGAISIRFKSAH